MALSVTVVDRAGSASQHEVAAGEPLMHLLRDIGAVDAVCGGAAACGTCLVAVAPEWRDTLPVPDAEERAMLDAMGVEQPAYRLSCQIECAAALDGLSLQVTDAG